jgi:hypothetical protein
MGELYGQNKGNRVFIGQEETSWVRPPASYMPKTSSLSLASVRNLILPGTNTKTAGKPFVVDLATRDEHGGRGSFEQDPRVQREKMIDKYVQGGPNSTRTGRFLREHFAGGRSMRAIGDIGDGITYGKSRWAGGEKGEAMKAFGGAAARGGGELATTLINASLFATGPVPWAAKGGLAAIRMAVRAGGKSALGAAGRKGLASSATSAAKGQVSAGLPKINWVMPKGTATRTPGLRAGIKSTAKAPPGNPVKMSPQGPSSPSMTHPYRPSSQPAPTAPAQVAPAPVTSTPVTSAPGVSAPGTQAAPRLSKKDQWLAKDKKTIGRFTIGTLAAVIPNSITQNSLGSGADSYGWKQNSRTSMGTGEKNPYLY